LLVKKLICKILDLNKQQHLAAFRGATRVDAQTGLEVFEINADISPTPALTPPAPESEG
jgi:hypothetical protein